MASHAFWSTFRNPQVAISGQGQDARNGRYEYIAAWYDGLVFLDVSIAAYLKKTYRLYRHTRLLWNPVPSIINFWAGIIYPGNLSEDGMPFNADKPTAVPFNEDIPPELAAAFAQIMIWGNFQQVKNRWPRTGSLVGNGLLQIKDDRISRKVYLEPTRAEHVADVQINPQGDLVMYALQYKTRDSDAPSSPEYTYRKVVTRTTISTFRDGKAWAYMGADGVVVPAVVDHPYGFCPAVWVSHQDGDGIFGVGAIDSLWGTLGALAEINSLESRINDGVNKFIEPLTVFITDGPVDALFKRPKRGPTDDPDTLKETDLDRESLPLLKAKAGTDIKTVAGNLNVDGARQLLLDAKTHFRSHYPEVDLYPQLREMQQVTGPAAEILMGDVATPVREIRANYDRQLIKALQMAVTIAAIRAKEDWGTLDKAREKFRQFDEGSFERGEFDFEIQDRPLIPDPPLSEQEKVDIADKKINRVRIPEEEVWEEMGYPEEKIKKWKADAEARRTELLAAQTQNGPQGGPQAQPEQPGRPPQQQQQPSNTGADGQAAK
jgi:hypothetical protein